MAAADDRQKSIQEFRKLLEGEKNLYLGEPVDDGLLNMYLNYTHDNVEKAFKKVVSNCKLKAKNIEYFALKRDPDLHDKILEKGIFQMLDKRDQLGRRIFLIRIKFLTYGEFEVHELIQMPDLFLNLAVDEEETQKKGLVFICDMDGMSWSILRYFSTQAVGVAVAKAENIPVREPEIHVLNAGFVVNTAVKIVFPFLSQRFKDLIHFHSDLESLYEYVDPSALPEEYGGEMPPVDGDRLVREFLDTRNERLAEILSYGYTSYTDSEAEEEELEKEEVEEEESD